MRAGRQKLQVIQEAVEPVLQTLGLDLIAVERSGENGRRILRLVVDRRGGVDLELCAEASRLADPVIDGLGETEHDFLEVSSPGLDRPLKTDRDLERHVGEAVEVRLYEAVEGARKHAGTLLESPPDTVVIRGKEGQERTFARAKVAKVLRTIRFP